MVGGYTEFRAATQEELDLFASLKAEISSQANGADLVVSEVATQLVSGMNYKFKAAAGADAYEVVIYKKGAWDGGEASVTSVTKA